MTRLVGNLITIPNLDGITINEYLGAANDDGISVATMKVNKPAYLNWMQNEYAEWITVMKGRIIVMDSQKYHFEVCAGQTAYIEKNERFRTIYPDSETEYIAICMPAFKPERHHPESEIDVDSIVLQLLEQKTSRIETDISPSTDIIYHMCLKSTWEEAKRSKNAYFPSTFVQDGHFTHSTAIPERLIQTANHFYQHVSGDWLCLQISREKLYQRGIIVKDEDPLPVGNQAVDDEWSSKEWRCPHIYGGIPVNDVVTAEFPMTREGVTFTGIIGLI